jgi:hypothetical protein
LRGLGRIGRRAAEHVSGDAFLPGLRERLDQALGALIDRLAATHQGEGSRSCHTA